MSRRGLVITFLLLAVACAAVVTGQGSVANSNAKTRFTRPAPRLRSIKWTQDLPANPETPVYNVMRAVNVGDLLPNHPLTISRFFAKGEIPHFPAAAMEGVAVPTQADVKTRWPDGSVQHAIISIRADFPPRSSSGISFYDTEQPLTGDPLTAEQMLSPQFDFGARMELTTSDGQVHSVDIRDMVAAGAFRYWLKGPICTQVIVEDSSDANAFDIDFNGYKSFHPIFVATFYPGSAGVKIDFIGENAWIDRMQDLQYSLALRTGNPLSGPFYQKNDYKHIALSRWRKTAWSGPQPAQIIQELNLPYMIYSRAVPNFDLSLNVPRSAVDQEIAAFNKTDRGDLGGNGRWLRYFPNTGGRPDIGLFPKWDVIYLYTFDSNLREAMLTNDAVSAHVPIHYRETSSSRVFSQLLPDVSARGRVASVDARPGFCSRSASFSTSDDGQVKVGPVSNGGWSPDIAHQGSFAYISYLTTGDWFYLEEMYFWASWNLAFSDPGTCSYCRGGTFAYIASDDNARGYGWSLRTVAHAAVMAPDGSPEKAYFTDKLLNNIVLHEGVLNITDGLGSTDETRKDLWAYGRRVYGFNMSNPLFFWDTPKISDVSSNLAVDPAKTYYASAPWMHNLIGVVLGHMEELGLPVHALRHESLKNLAGQLLDPTYNRYLIDAYFIPSAPARLQFFQDWAGVLDAIPSSSRERQHWMSDRVNDTDFGYGYIALAAASFLIDTDWQGRSGSEGWNWLYSNYPRNRTAQAANPKWAFVPRTVPTAGSLAQASSWQARFRVALEKPKPLVKRAQR
jgi:hypothetical protein